MHVCLWMCVCGCVVQREEILSKDSPHKEAAHAALAQLCESPINVVHAVNAGMSPPSHANKAKHRNAQHLAPPQLRIVVMSGLVSALLNALREDDAPFRLLASKNLEKIIRTQRGVASHVFDFTVALKPCCSCGVGVSFGCSAFHHACGVACVLTRLVIGMFHVERCPTLFGLKAHHLGGWVAE